MRPFPLPPFVEHRLPSGLLLRAARWGKRPTVGAALLFPGAGSVSDPEGLEGLAEVAADTFLDGTRTRSGRELAEAIDDLALSCGVSAGYDSAVAHMGILERDLDAGLALFAEVLAEPAFHEEEVDRNRRRHADSLREQRSEPDFLGRERLMAELYRGHPYARLAATEKGLAALTTGNVREFYSSRFGFGNATLVLVGAGDEEMLLAAAVRAVAAAPAGPAPAWTPPAPPSARRGLSFHLIDRKEAVQTNLLFARPAIKRADPAYATAIVANQSLGGGASSRLFHVLREERGLTYGTYSSVSPRLTAGHFGASIDCRTDATREALRLRGGGPDRGGARPLAALPDRLLRDLARDAGRPRPGRGDPDPARTPGGHLVHLARTRRPRHPGRSPQRRGPLLHTHRRRRHRRRAGRRGPPDPRVDGRDDGLGLRRPEGLTSTLRHGLAARSFRTSPPRACTNAGIERSKRDGSGHRRTAGGLPAGIEGAAGAEQGR